MAGIHRKTRGNREAGQTLFLTAMSLVVLVGMLGLGIDLGAMRYEKRLQQTAADAAAIAAASDLQYSGDTGATAAAVDAAKDNGFSDTGTCTTGCPNPGTPGYVTVTMNDPPSSGPHSTASPGQYAEVLVSEVHPTYFMRIFGVDKETVTARAVAGSVGSAGPNGTCMYALGLSVGLALPVINANVALDLGGCGIAANGLISGIVHAVNCLLTGCAASNGPAVSDPLAYLARTPPPAVGGCQSPNVSGNATAGDYCNGLTITGTTTLGPGVYFVNGNLAFTGTGTVSGNDVMFYVTNGTVNWGTGGGQTNLTAPASSDSAAGAVGGVLFWQDESDQNAATIDAGGSSSFNGVMYFPGAAVTFGSGTISADIVVAGAVTVDAQLSLGGATGLSGAGLANPITVPTLVE